MSAVVLVAACGKHRAESESSPPDSECAAASEVPADLAGVRGAYGHMTRNAREGFPCELWLSGAAAVQVCSPSERQWGEVRIGDDGPELVLRYSLSGATLSEEPDPTPRPIRVDSGRNRMLLGTTCWGGPDRGESFERLATPVVGVWQRVGEGAPPRRLWIGPYRWRELEASRSGDVEPASDPEGGWTLQHGGQSHHVVPGDDRSRLTIDGVAYVHERAPTVQCDEGREVKVGESVTLRLEGSDPDGGPVTWWLRRTGAPKGSAFSGTTDEVSPTFVPDVPGEHTFLATATDDEGSEATCHPWVVAVP